MFSFRHESHPVFIDLVSDVCRVVLALYQTCCNQFTLFIPNEKKIQAGQRHTALRSAVPSSATQRSAKQRYAAQRSAKQRYAAQCQAALRSAAQLNILFCNMQIQHSASERSAAQHMMGLEATCIYSAAYG